MEQLQESSQPVRCKLYSAFVACDMPSIAELELPGSETFSRDPEICDACLAPDYSAQGPISSEWWMAANLGGCFAIVVFVALGFLRGRQSFERFVPLRTSSPILGNALIAVVAGTCFALIARLLLRLWIGRWSRGPETAEGAARYRWLARWAELTGHDKFKKRMLKKAVALDARFGGSA
ncbi:MAG TPA: hypothetical protein VFW23_02535 [Tepidisphaeraceae bacterium]|nr:hypothetical protein [Tepidisphaeraceae bacterium]